MIFSRGCFAILGERFPHNGRQALLAGQTATGRESERRIVIIDLELHGADWEARFTRPGGEMDGEAGAKSCSSLSPITGIVACCCCFSNVEYPEDGRATTEAWRDG